MTDDREAVAEVNGDELVIRIRMPRAPASAPAGDRLIRLEQKACAEAGFELRGLQAKVRAGELATVKIGRASYVRMSDLCALAKPATLSGGPEPDDEADFRATMQRALAAPPRRPRRRASHGT